MLRIAALLAVLLPLLVADAGAAGPCAPGARVVATAGQAQLVRDRGSDALWACRPAGRLASVEVGDLLRDWYDAHAGRPRDAALLQLANVRLRPRYVAWTSAYLADAPGATLGFGVHVTRLGTATPAYRGRRFGDPAREGVLVPRGAVTDLELRADGAVAWIAEDADAVREVVVVTAAGLRRVATGPEVDPASLALGARAARWTEAGQPRSAPVARRR